MRNLIKIDASGYVWGTKITPNPPDDGWIEVDFDPSVAMNGKLCRYIDGVFEQTNKPMFPENSFDVWDENIGEWVDGRTLEQKKDDKWLEIKAARDAQEFGTFDWGGYTFQCDEVSQRRIQGAVQLAGLDPTLVMDWTLADNSVQSFTATDFIAIGQALAVHVNAGHVKSRALRSQIESATTEAEISAITW